MKKILLFLILMFIFVAPIWAKEKAINNLVDYFEYLPNAVHNNWSPYKSNKDYEVIVQFEIKKNGEISQPKIVSSTNEKANTSVLNAVTSGAPYKPLPATYKRDFVKAQIELKYSK